jgi:hypothetical protein
MFWRFEFHVHVVKGMGNFLYKSRMKPVIKWGNWMKFQWLQSCSSSPLITIAIHNEERFLMDFSSSAIKQTYFINHWKK